MPVDVGGLEENYTVDDPIPNLGGLVLLGSTLAGFLTIVRSVRRARYADAAGLLAIYIVPAALFFWALPHVVLLAARLFPSLALDPEQWRVFILLLLAPLLGLWIIFLFVGGYASWTGDFELRDFLRAHATRASLCEKAVGGLAFAFGSAVLIATITLIPPSPWRIPGFVCGLYLSIVGSVSIAIPSAWRPGG